MDDRQIFQDAFLDLFQSVVILVEDALRFFEVGIGSGGFVPWELSKIGTFAGPIAMLAGALVTVGFAE